jgi:hypothetical protein
VPEDLGREHVQGLLADMIIRGLSPSMVSITYRALQQSETPPAVDRRPRPRDSGPTRHDQPAELHIKTGG